MRATHPSLLLLPLLAAALIALKAHSAAAADLVFAEGRTWTDVKIVSQEPTNLIVLAGGKVKAADFSYCDVWRFENGRMAELNAFVIPRD